MDRVQGASFIAFDRPLLGQMAIATVLVGSAAALSSAGIAVPVNNVGFAKGWHERAPDTARFSPAAVAAQLPVNARLSVPGRVAGPASASVQVRHVDRSVPGTALTNRQAPMTPIDTAQSPRLAEANATRIVSTPPIPIALTAPLAEPAVAALAVSPAAIAPPGAAPASLAVAAPAPAPEVAPLGEQALPVSAAVPFRLVNPPELRGFDLARMSALPKSVPAGFARPAAKSAVSGKVEGLGKKDTVVGDDVFHQVSVSVAGSDGKSIDVRIGADMKPSVKVGDLLGLVSDRMDPDSAARFAAASSAGDYVSLATLRAAGFDVAYNAGADSISISVAQ